MEGVEKLGGLGEAMLKYYESGTLAFAKSLRSLGTLGPYNITIPIPIGTLRYLNHNRGDSLQRDEERTP